MGYAADPAHRHEHGDGQGVPRHVRRFRGIETNLRRERQLEGIAKAKADGVYRGGKRRIDREAVWKLRKAGKGPTQISTALGFLGCRCIASWPTHAMAAEPVVRRKTPSLLRLASSTCRVKYVIAKLEQRQ